MSVNYSKQNLIMPLFSVSRFRKQSLTRDVHIVLVEGNFYAKTL